MSSALPSLLVSERDEEEYLTNFEPRRWRRVRVGATFKDHSRVRRNKRRAFSRSIARSLPLSPRLRLIREVLNSPEIFRGTAVYQSEIAQASTDYAVSAGPPVTPQPTILEESGPTLREMLLGWRKDRVDPFPFRLRNDGLDIADQQSA